MRGADIKRKTSETEVALSLAIEGKGDSVIDTGVGFLDHMLTLFAKHGRLTLAIKAVGDNNVDDHHTVEDVGIALGQAVAEALGDKKGIKRYGDCVIPMDEALVMSAVDISGRAYLGYALEIPTEKVGSFDTELVEEFWTAFVRNAGITLHIRQLAGKNSHHIIEASFKSVARSLKEAMAIDEQFANDVPSTKGVL